MLVLDLYFEKVPYESFPERLIPRILLTGEKNTLLKNQHLILSLTLHYQRYIFTLLENYVIKSKYLPPIKTGHIIRLVDHKKIFSCV